MKKLLILLSMVIAAAESKAQKVDSIYFNLYTDSLKKGVHNYINVDGKLSNGKFYPLMSSEVVLTSSAGRWEGNSLILDTSFTQDSVVVWAYLKESPEVKRMRIIYLKKVDSDGELISEKELLEQWRKKPKKKTELVDSRQ